MATVEAFLSVLEHSESEGVDRLVMFALCDTCMNEDGEGNCGLSHMAKWANAPIEEIEPALQRLCAAGEIAVFESGVPGRVGFQILLEAPA